MTDEDLEKAAIMENQMLNSRGMSELSKLGVYKKLIESVSIKDLNAFKKNRVFFNPILSPGSQTILPCDLKKGTKIITIDINTIKLFTSDEGVAIILHEIGHALNQATANLEDAEYAADDYAVKRGYGEWIVSSLEKGKAIRPAEFVKDMTEKRIVRIKKNKK